MSKAVSEIQDEIQMVEQMILRLRRGTDDAWSYVNSNMEELICLMMEIVKWAQKLVENGQDFPIDVILQQVQNLNEAYTGKDEVLLADTLEYEITNALYVYLEKGEE